MDWIVKGERAYFKDPDGTETSSGIYLIHEVCVDDGDEVLGDTMVILRREDGVTMEVHAHELRELPDFDDVIGYFGLDESFLWDQERIDDYSIQYINALLAEENNLVELEALRKLFSAVKTGSADDVEDAVANVERARSGVGPAPVNVVIEINGGLIKCVRSDAPVRVALLDEDTEGGDEDRIGEVNGEEVYISLFNLDGPGEPGFNGIDRDFVRDTFEQVEEALSDDDAAGQSPSRESP